MTAIWHRSRLRAPMQQRRPRPVASPRPQQPLLARPQPHRPRLPSENAPKRGSRVWRQAETSRLQALARAPVLPPVGCQRSAQRALLESHRLYHPAEWPPCCAVAKRLWPHPERTSCACAVSASDAFSSPGYPSHHRAWLVDQAEVAAAGQPKCRRWSSCGPLFPQLGCRRTVPLATACRPLHFDACACGAASTRGSACENGAFGTSGRPAEALRQ